MNAADKKAAVARWLSLSQEERQALQQFLAKQPLAALQVSGVRALLAKMRINRLTPEAIRTADGVGDDLVENAIEHNLDGLKAGSSLLRPTVLVQPLLSIGAVQRRMQELDVLTIGPRTEAELFVLFATGFNPYRITGLDLISYSPMVDVGDMHAMPYPDDSFDVVVAGWVLAYSSNQQKAAQEILRVARPGAFIAVGCEHSVQSGEDQAARMAGQNLDYKLAESGIDTAWSEERILALFGDRVAKVHFVSDDSAEQGLDLGGVIVIFRIT